MKVTGRIKHVKPIQLEDFLFLKSISGDAMPKVSIPSPTMAHFRAGRAGIPERIYPDVRFLSLSLSFRLEGGTRLRVFGIYLAQRFLRRSNNSLPRRNPKSLRRRLSIHPTRRYESGLLVRS
jgi:hypothetical protein